MTQGQFIISLDYELHWGFFDKKSVEDYSENLNNVTLVINKLLELAEKYQVKLTFATVGFLFAKNKEELLQHSPKKKPQYKNPLLDPYRLFDSIGNDENDDPYHYGYSVLKDIQQHKDHEIATHTFCHYYCNEEGQNLEEFEEDIIAAKKIATSFGSKIESIVFPRNQVHQDYITVCSKNDIKSFRGTEKAHMYSISPKSKNYNSPIIRLQRLVDTYLNITGQNTYNVLDINKGKSIVNLPSSRFLRAYNKRLKLLEPLKLRRIKKGMSHAAKNNELFHLWWHPHNFGKNINENFKNLESIFVEYQKLHKRYGFQTETMRSLTEKITSNN